MWGKKKKKPKIRVKICNTLNLLTSVLCIMK